jgi:hypothetical protein
VLWEEPKANIAGNEARYDCVVPLKVSAFTVRFCVPVTLNEANAVTLATGGAQGILIWRSTDIATEPRGITTVVFKVSVSPREAREKGEAGSSLAAKTKDIVSNGLEEIVNGANKRDE